MSIDYHFKFFRFGAPKNANRYFFVGAVAEQQISVRI